MRKKNLQLTLCIWFTAFSLTVCQAGRPTVDHLTVSEGFKNPIGFYDANPSFSWQLAQDGSVQRQSAYRIVAAKDPALLPEQADLWDSGKVLSDQSVYVPYQGQELESRQRVYWQVQYWDEQDRASTWSKPAHFELGLLDNNDWQGQWIRKVDEKTTEDAKDKKTYVPEYLRKEFSINSPIASARLFVTAKGLYEVSLNGQRVGRDFMAPGWTPYHKRIETLTYDVTKQIHQSGQVCL